MQLKFTLSFDVKPCRPAVQKALGRGKPPEVSTPVDKSSRYALWGLILGFLQLIASFFSR